MLKFQGLSVFLFYSRNVDIEEGDLMWFLIFFYLQYMFINVNERILGFVLYVRSKYREIDCRR